jgi:hypothetical protein
MKTAIQTLISQIENEINKEGNGSMAIGFDYGLKKAKQFAEELLEMEKEQLLQMSTKSAHYERKWILEHSTDKEYRPDKIEIRDLKKTALEHYNETFKLQES